MKLIGTASISFVFASIFAYLPNWIYKRYFPIKRNKIYARAIRKYGDELDNIFFSGLLGGKLIQITLKNEKVYLGFVIEVGGPRITNYIAMLPLLSGYRETESKILWITTTYEEVINAITSGEKLPLNDFKIVMNQDKILVASFFDPDIYDKFQEQMENKKSQQIKK